ncbi:glycoside hydrolase family 25 protein [Cereibacter sediminicola]|uniref:glycoside hydrolase family 25 protein n=1 Tax=Cereibacter sediminicola TaxID=2584941 RepID=UPI0011A3BF58|nr:GH25 family lysozyme [Cereibacter sediminicola]
MNPRLLAFGLAVLLLSCGRPPVTAELPSGQTVTIAAPSFGDAKPHPWAGRAPSAYPVHGIDVSRFQGPIDWPTAASAGVSFAFIKATEGGDRLDAAFHENWRGAGRAGVPRGAYHFFYFCRPASEQAEWFIRNVPNSPRALPPVLDMEWNPYSPTCTFRPEPAVVRAEALTFLRQVGQHYGKRPIIYTTVDFFERNEMWRLTGYDFWLRSVAAHPHERYNGHPWTFWQYTGTGIVPGIDKITDINVFNGSAAQWAAWLALNLR